MTKKQKRTLTRILAAAALFAAVAAANALLPLPWFAALALYLIPYFVIGYDVLRKAILGIVHGEIFDENFLMAIATVGAMALGEYGEGVAVMLFYQVGELFQSYAVGKSRRNIAALMDIRPDSANLEAGDGTVTAVAPEDVPVGAVIVTPEGEAIVAPSNRCERDSDPTAHAEILAMREAGRVLGSVRLTGCTLVVTLEPCTMCAGAAVLARVSRIVLGAWDPKTGACGSIRDVVRDARLNHRIEVVGGVREAENAALLREFFIDRR